MHADSCHISVTVMQHVYASSNKNNNNMGPRHDLLFMGTRLLTHMDMEEFLKTKWCILTVKLIVRVVVLESAN